MITRSARLGDMEGEEARMLVKRKGEADSVWDSLFSGISPEGNTLLTARCSQIGEIVCFPWGAENFTTICVSNCVCRSSAKDYSGVRHFRESNDRTGFEPEPSAPLSDKTRFFFEKNDFRAQKGTGEVREGTLNEPVKAARVRQVT